MLYRLKWYYHVKYYHTILYYIFHNFRFLVFYRLITISEYLIFTVDLHFKNNITIKKNVYRLINNSLKYSKFLYKTALYT